MCLNSNQIKIYNSKSIFLVQISSSRGYFYSQNQKIVHTCLFGTVSQCVSQKKFLHMFNTAFLLFFCFSLAVLQLQTIVLLIAAIFTPSHPLSKKKLFCFVLVTCSRKVTLLCTSFYFLPPYYCFDLFSLVVLTFFGNISRLKHVTKMIEI